MVNESEGAFACPSLFIPQQVTAPFVFTPQEWNPPAETVEKGPAGGVACPKSFNPQQAADSFVRIPHEWFHPAET